MNLILSWSTAIFTMLFYQSNQISTIEIWIYRVSIAVFLLFMILFFIARTTGSNNKNNLREEEYVKNARHIVPQNNIEGHITRLTNRIKTLEDKVKILQQEKNRNRPFEDKKTDTRPDKSLMEGNKKSKNSVSEVYDDMPSQEIVLPIDRGTDNSNHSKQEIAYLNSPDKDKAFFAPEATSNPTEKTLYAVEDGNLKLYDKVNEQTMRLALNSLDIFVKRVCDILNAKEPHHSKIVMVEPGRVTKEKDDFLVVNKIKVKFE